MIRERSLFVRFFAGFALTMFLVWLAVLAWEATTVQGQFDRAQRAETRGWARQILAAVRVSAQRPDELRDTVRRIEAARHELFVENGFPEPPWHLEVWRRKELLHASRDADAPLDVEAGPDWTTWTETDPDAGVTVRVAQRNLIIWSFALAAIPRQLAPLFWCFPFLLLPAWLTIRYGLRPVKSIVAQIEQRSEHLLSPLAPTLYRELSPLVRSTNHLMARLQARLQREQEFLADAAHQIKTPLAVIQANAELLADARDPAILGAAQAGLQEGVVDAAHVTHQLLALARSGADSGETARCLDFADLVRRRLAQAVGVALVRQVEIEFDGPDACPMRVFCGSMTALLDNLVDNAIKYSPKGGTVRVGLRREPDFVELSVQDQGRGIPADMRCKVFERFFRIPGQDEVGSGLGLAIVERAALRHGGRVALDDGPGGTGLLVIVRFEALEEATEPARMTD